MSYEEIIYPIGFINQQLVHLRSDEQEQGDLSFSFLYTYNSCFSTLALAGRPLFLVVGLAFET